MDYGRRKNFTTQIPEKTIRQIKVLAAQNGRTVSEVATEALIRGLSDDNDSPADSSRRGKGE